MAELNVENDDDGDKNNGGGGESLFPLRLNGGRRREGARAEALMREHSRLAQRNLREALRSPLHLPGAHLISPSS